MVLSIIVPLYNVEKYIADCLNSIYNQEISETKFEVICIDDYSPDNSKEIVKDHQKTHTNLRLIEHEVNKGLGGARNTGIKEAKGDYVWFIDSDDTIEDNCLSKIFITLEKIPDTLLFNYNEWNPLKNLKLKTFVFDDSDKLNGIEFIDKYFDSGFVYHLGYVWRMIIKRKLIIENKLKFPENTWGEDTAFFPAAIIFSNSVISTNESFYNYRLNLNSATNTLKHEKKAKLIYEFAFGSAFELIELNNKIKTLSPKYCNIFDRQVQKFCNQFIFDLLKTNMIEKKSFFNLISINKRELELLICKMNYLNKFICKHPKIGFLITIIISPLYLLKRRILSNKN